jgi:hypothetical protein
LEKGQGCWGGLPAERGGGSAGRSRWGADDARRGARDLGGWGHGTPFSGCFGGRPGGLEKIFAEARDAEYTEVLGRCRDFHAELDKERSAGNLTFAELEENEEDLAKLEAWVGKIRVRDRFGAPLFGEVERELVACREDLQAFAASVYEAADRGSAGSS